MSETAPEPGDVTAQAGLAAAQGDTGPEPEPEPDDDEEDGG